MSTQTQNKFIIGLITGMLLTLAVGIIIKKSGHCPFAKKSSDILVEFDGGKLSRTELEKTLTERLVPIQNDEYSLLSNGIENWLETTLLEKEAKLKGLEPKDIYVKEIWTQVRVTPGDGLAYFQKNSGLYGGQNYDSVAPLLMHSLRLEAYEKAKREYVGKLKEKFHVKVHLEKPAAYVAGLALGDGDNNPMAAILGAAPSLKLAAPSTPPPAAPAPAAPAAVVTFTDLEGRPSTGPANAPVTLVEFSDFMCPFCKRVNPTVDQLMKAYPGKIRRVWRHYPLSFHQGADRIAMASECANEQGKFWEFHDKMFENLGGAHDDAALAQAAQQVGANKGKFEACLASNKYAAVVQQDMAKAAQVGVNGTPAFFINGRLLSGAQPYESFSKLVEVALDPSKANLPAFQQPQAPAPRPTPTNVQFTDLKGRPSVGPENAAITLVEFSDFHCPFCKRVEPTMDQLMKNYAGKIRKVWRHYPLPFHTGADHTHEASECAHEQGKFWEFHGKLFETMGGSRDDGALLQIADQLKLNRAKFQQCLTSGKYKELVKQDIAKGNEVGVSGTPAVFVNGQLVSGAQPYESFDKIIKEKLASK